MTDNRLQKVRNRTKTALERLRLKRTERGLPVDDLPELETFEAEIARRAAAARIAEAEAKVARLRAQVEARRGAASTADTTEKPSKRKRRRAEPEPEPGKGAAITAGSTKYRGLSLVYSDGHRSEYERGDTRTWGPNDIGRDEPA